MVNNKDLKYDASLIVGVNNNGEFCASKANTDDIDLKPYKIVNNGDFVYNPSRINIGSLAYRTQGMCIVSHLYVVFHLNEKGLDCIIPEYLFLYFKRKEFGRLVTYLNFGSQRPEFNFFQMSDIEIPLPPIKIQQQLVGIYEGLTSVIEQNEALLKPIYDACQAFIIDCKAKYPAVRLGEYIEEIDNPNIEDASFPFAGININKEFMKSVANTVNVDRKKYKIIKRGQFVFSGMQTGRDKCIRIGLYGKETPALLSPAYTIFKIKNSCSDLLIPEYLFMYFLRKEMDRLGWFYSDASIRSNLDWDRFCDIQIPLPPIEVQHSIVSLYHCAYEAQRIIADAKEQLKQLCPALVQLAIHYKEKTE